MDLHLQGKRAFVAGSSRGLGYAMARRLAQEGARVAINSRSQTNTAEAAARLKAETGADVIAIPGDLTNPLVPEKIIAQVAAGFGGLDILVTNAGGPPSGPFEKFDDATWETAIDASLFSHIRLIRAALPCLRQGNDPAILTITSYSVKQPIPNLVLSNSIRAGTVGLTKTLAMELGPQGIRVNSILPGWTETQRVRDLMDYRAKANGTTIDEEIEKQARETALGRMGSPDEFASAAVFLVSPAASYITGVMLQVDGGITKSTY